VQRHVAGVVANLVVSPIVKKIENRSTVYKIYERISSGIFMAHDSTVPTMYRLQWRWRTSSLPRLICLQSPEDPVNQRVLESLKCIALHLMTSFRHRLPSLSGDMPLQQGATE